MHTQPESRDEQIETLAENRWYLLLSDQDGFSIWVVKDRSNEALAVFPPTVEGSDLAWDRFDSLTIGRRWRAVGRVGVWTVLVFGAIWLLLALAFLIVTFLVTGGLLDDASGELVFRLSSLFSGLYIMPVAFSAAVGIYLVVWTMGRSRKKD